MRAYYGCFMEPLDLLNVFFLASETLSKIIFLSPRAFLKFTLATNSEENMSIISDF